MLRTKQKTVTDIIAEHRKELAALKALQSIDISNMNSYSQTVVKRFSHKGQAGFDITARYKFSANYAIGTISISRGYGANGPTPLPGPSKQIVQTGNGEMVAYSWILGADSPDYTNEFVVSATVVANVPGELTVEINEYTPPGST